MYPTNMQIDITTVVNFLLPTLQIASQQLTEPALTSLNQFMTTVIQILPKVIAATIILGIGYVVGKAVGWAIRKVLTKMNFEKTMQKTSLGEATSRSGWTMTKITSTATQWFVYLFFIAAAVNALEFTQLSQALTTIWLWIPNLIAFIVILVIGSIIADFVGNWVQRELPARGITAGKTIGMAAKGILYTIVFVTAITQLHIGSEILNTVISALVWGLAAAVAIGLGVGLAYGLKEVMPSLITGSTQVETTLKPGQKVKFDGHAGTIRQAGAFHIVMQNTEDQTIVLPTKMIADKEIIIESGPLPETPGKKIESITKSNN
jgi:hypothetical protein